MIHHDHYQIYNLQEKAEMDLLYYFVLVVSTLLICAITAYAGWKLQRVSRVDPRRASLRREAGALLTVLILWIGLVSRVWPLIPTVGRDRTLLSIFYILIIIKIIEWAQWFERLRAWDADRVEGPEVGPQ
jgi:hypothetical protein